MKNKISNKLLIALNVILIGNLILTACQKEFLEVAPTGQLTEEVLSSKKGIEGVLIGAYSMLGGRGNYFGGAGLAPFHDFDSVVPQEVKDSLAEIDAGLKDGSITTGYGQ